MIEGDELIVESPVNAFEPFIVHYAETFIVPAVVGDYTIRPYGISEGKNLRNDQGLCTDERITIEYQLNTHIYNV